MYWHIGTLASPCKVEQLRRRNREELQNKRPFVSSPVGMNLGWSYPRRRTIFQWDEMDFQWLSYTISDVVSNHQPSTIINHWSINHHQPFNPYEISFIPHGFRPGKALLEICHSPDVSRSGTKLWWVCWPPPVAALTCATPSCRRQAQRFAQRFARERATVGYVLSPKEFQQKGTKILKTPKVVGFYLSVRLEVHIS